MSLPVQPVAPILAWFEQRLAQEEESGDNDKTLFVQLTDFEFTMVQFGLWWILKMYGPHSAASLVKKLHDLVKTQEFCDCPSCRAEREKEDDS